MQNKFTTNAEKDNGQEMIDILMEGLVNPILAVRPNLYDLDVPVIYEENGVTYKIIAYEGSISMAGQINAAIADGWSVVKADTSVFDGCGTLTVAKIAERVAVK